MGQSIDSTQQAVPGTTITLQVSTGYKDVKVQVPLPDYGEAVDMKVYVGGKVRVTETDVLPSVMRVWSITLTETQDEYEVTVMIAKHGSGEMKTYAKYLVDGINGSATETFRDENVLGSTTPAVE